MQMYANATNTAKANIVLIKLLTRSLLWRAVKPYVVAATMLCASFVLCTNMTVAQNVQGPDVLIIAEEERLIYEFRQNGNLRYIRIVPNRGKPYYLVPSDPTRGNGNLERVDSLMASWVFWQSD
jgi:hypothetical protein